MSLFSMVKIIIVSVWVVSMGWLIRFEAFPHWFEDTVQGYSELARDLPALQDSWMKIMFDGQHVGYVHSGVMLEEADGQEEVTLSTQMVLQINIQGKIENFRMKNEVRLDQNQNLKSNRMDFYLGDLIKGSVQVEPVPEKEERYALELILEIESMPDFRIDREITLPRDVILASPLMDTGLRSLRPGQTRSVRTLDVFSMDGGTQTVVMRGEPMDVDTMEVEGNEVKVSKVSITMGEIQLIAIIDEYGRVIRQETPFGVDLVFANSQVAMQFPESSALDLMTFLTNSPLSKLPVSL
jgi:hypothetical protein